MTVKNPQSAKAGQAVLITDIYVGDQAFVELGNISSDTFDLGGSLLRSSEGNQRFVFPVGTMLPAGETLRVYSGKPDATFRFSGDGNVWRSEGDVGLLENPDGEFLALLSYGDKTAEDLNDAGYQAVVLEDRPAGYWPLNETDGALVLDLSGNGQHGTYKGGVTQDVEGCALGEKGALFNGKDGYVELPGDWGTGSELTVEAWVKVDDLTGDYMAIVSSTALEFVHFQLHTSGNTGVYTNPDRSFLPCGVPTPHVWQHLVMTFKPGETIFYLNGREDHRVATSYKTIKKSSKVRIGCGYGNKRFFKGTIDEVAIYNHALSPERVAEHFRAAGEEVLYFDGKDHYLSTQLEEIDFSGGVTIEAWARFEAFNHFSRIIDFANGPGVDNLLLANHGTTNNLSIYCYKDGSSHFVSAADVLEQNTWQHLAAVIAADGTTTLYVDGVSVGTGSLPLPATIKRTRSYLGRSNWDSDGYFHGSMSEVRLWNRARAQQEILAEMSQRLRGTEPGLVGLWSLDRIWDLGSQQRTGDLAGCHAAIVHGPCFSRDPDCLLAPRDEKAPRTLVFDGNTHHLSAPDHQALHLPAYSVEIWLKPKRPNSTWDGIFGKPGRNFQIWLNNTGYIHHRFHNSKANTGAPDTPKGSIIWDHWNHVAITNDGTTAKTFINGSLEAEGPTGGPLHLAESILYLGRNPDGGNSEYFNGRLADVRFWDHAREEADICRLMHKRLSGSEMGLVTYWRLEKVGAVEAGSETPDHMEQMPLTVHGATVDGDETLPIAGEVRGLAENAYTSAVLADKPIAYWQLEETEGEVAYDCSGNSRHATIVGGVTLEREGAFDGSRGFTFNGRDAYLDIPGDWGGKSGLTIEAWVFCDASTLDFQTVICSPTGPWAHFQLHDSGNIVVHTDNGTVVLPILPQAPSGVWRHLVLTAESGDIRMYVNGVKIAQSSHEFGTIASASALRIGANNGRMFLGGIDEVALYDFPLAEERVKAHYRAAYPVPAMCFDGQNDHVELPEMDFTFSDGFTLEAWARFDSFNKFSRIIDFGKGPAADNILLCNYETTNSLRFYLFNNSTDLHLHGTGVLVKGQWQHLAVSLDGEGHGRLYVDGALVTEGRLAPPAAVIRTKCYLGRSNWDTDAYFEGAMAEVRLWNHARTETEIRADKHRRMRGTEAGLSALWPLDRVWDMASGKRTPDLAGSLVGRVQEAEVRPDGYLPLDGAPFAPPDVFRTNGLTNYLSVPDQPGLRIRTYTAELWLNAEGAPNEGWKGLFGKKGRNMNIWLHSTAYLLHQFNNFKSYTGGFPDTPKGGITWNRWVHIAITNDGVTPRTLIDGEVVREGPLGGVGLHVHSTVLNIARHTEGVNGNYFKGRLAEVRLWDHGRSPEEIARFMHTRLSGVELGLHAYWRLEQVDTSNEQTTTPDKIGAMPMDVHGGALVQDEGLPVAGEARSAEELAYADAVLDDLPLGFWQLEESDGAIAFDGSPHGRHGTINGDVHLDVAGAFPGSRAFRFGGGDGFIELPGLWGGGSELTIEAWVKPETLTMDFQTIVSSLTAQVSHFQLHGSGNNVVFTDTGNAMLEIIPQEPLNKWRHLVLTAKSGDTRIYVDGVVATRSEHTFTQVLAGEPLRIGMGHGARPFHGCIDEVAVYGSALSEERVKAHFRAAHAKQVVTFDGQAQFITLPHMDLDFSTGFALEAWVHFDVLGTHMRVLGMGNGPGSDNIRLINEQRDLGLFVMHGGTDQRLVAADVLKTGAWQHVAAVIGTDGKAALYLDGARVAEGAMLLPTAAVRTINHLGKGNWQSGDLFQGRMAEVRLWNRAPNPVEIAERMNRRLNGGEAGLVAYWPLRDLWRVGEALHTPDLAGTYPGTAQRYSLTRDALLPLDPSIRSQDAAMSFDGVGNHLTVADNKALHLKAYTVEFWLRPDGTPQNTWSGVFGKPGRNMQAWLNNNGYIHHRFHNTRSTNGGAPDTPTASVLFSEWNHIVMTNDGTTVQTWINNKIVAGGRSGGPLHNVASVLYLGRNPDGSDGNYFRGHMADVRIWDHVRTAGQIKGLMHHRLWGKEAGLVAYWPLNELFSTGGPISATEKVQRLHAQVIGAGMERNVGLPVDGQARQPILYLDQTAAAPGESLKVHFHLEKTLDASAWIGIVPSNIAHGSEATNDAHDLSYQKFAGKTSGSLTFTAPTTRGAYDFRLNDNDSNGKELASVSFTVA